MKELIFRYWDKDKEVMFIQGSQDYPTLHSFMNKFGYFPHDLMQYSGLSDNECNKIFEGDIVKVNDFTSVYKSEVIGIVVKRNCSFYLMYYQQYLKEKSFMDLKFDKFAEKKMRILGNIHQDKELLEKYNLI